MDKNFNKQNPQRNYGNQQQNPYTGSGTGNSGHRETPFRNPGQGNQGEQTGKSYKETGLGQEKQQKQEKQKPGQQSGAQTGQRGQKESRENPSLRPHGFPNNSGQKSKERNPNPSGGQDWNEGAGAEQEENLRGRSREGQIPPAGRGNEFEEDDEVDFRQKNRSRNEGNEEDDDQGNRI